MTLKVSKRGTIPPFIVMDVLRAANEREAQGQGVLHLELGQPGTSAPGPVLEAAAVALTEDRIGYTEALGLPVLRHRIAQHYRRYSRTLLRETFEQAGLKMERNTHTNVFLLPIILPAVLRYNAGHVGDKYAALTAAMGLGADADLAAEIEALNARLGLPTNLREMGVVDEVVPTMIEYSQADHSTATNPRPLEVADFEALFAASMG